MKHFTKKFTYILTLVLIALAAVSANAKEVTIGKLKYKVNTTDKIARCTGLATEATKNYNLVIPSTVKYNNVTLKVISVESEAFMWDDYLKKVTLSDYTETIGADAFSCCDNISIVSLGKNLKKIGNQAFYKCGLSSITLPETVESIGTYTFAYCEKLQSVNMGDKVKTIGDHAFFNCTALKGIILPGSLNTLGANAFTGCSSLYEVTFLSGNGNTVIGEKCFDNVKSLKLLNFSGPGVVRIGDSAFIGCNIEWLALPSSLRIIGEGAFAGNDLTLLILNEGLQSIGAVAFSDQTNNGGGLKELIIPSTVTFIGTNAFDWIGSLDKVICNATVPPVAEEKAFWNWVTWNSDLIIPVASVPAYKSAPVWKDFRFINGEQQTMSVEGIDADEDTVEQWFDLMGNEVSKDNLAPGVYIVRRNSGIEKVLIK